MRIMKAIPTKNASALQLNMAIVQEYMIRFGQITRKPASNTPTIRDRMDSSLMLATAPILISEFPTALSLKNKISTAVALRDMTLVIIDP